MHPSGTSTASASSKEKLENLATKHWLEQRQAKAEAKKLNLGVVIKKKEDNNAKATTPSVSLCDYGSTSSESD